MMSAISEAGVNSPLRTNDKGKDQILSSTKVAVRQVQSYYSVCNPDFVLSLDVIQLRQLCESLDRTFFYGLRECQQGYWPFVKQFTHNNTVRCIEALTNVASDLQRGRLWLCLALSENSLESYFRSFQDNPKIVRRHYFSLAILQDEQRMQLLIMLMAGLENVPINIDIEHISLGSGLEFFSPHHNAKSTASECGSDVSQGSSQESDAGITEGYDSEEVESNIVATLNPSVSEAQVVQSNCHCNMSAQEIEQVIKYINMSPQTGPATSADLEVIRTKVVRRVKKSPVHSTSVQRNCDEDAEKSEDSSSTEASSTKENRLSKATVDSGVSLASQCSSGRGSPEPGNPADKRELSFEVEDFQTELNVIFSTPVKQRLGNACDEEQVVDKTLPSEERGTPEGQEDPVSNSCGSQASASRQPLLPGDDGIEDEQISFYDLCKVHYMKSIEPVVVDTNQATEDTISVGSTVTSMSETDLETLGAAAKSKEEDPIAKELELLMASQPEDRLDISVDNNTLLFLLVEIYESDDEEFAKMFYGYLKEGGSLVLFLLTTKGVYILKPGGSHCKFICCGSAKYSAMILVTVILNYQGFVIETRDNQKLILYTADENLTRSILSYMEVIMRHSVPKFPLPGFATDATIQIRRLKKYIGSELKCSLPDVCIEHFVLVRWQNYYGSSSPATTPAGPKRVGNLVYRFRHKNSARNDDTWYPGHFVLKGGYLYCMEERNHAEPLFYIQICNTYCKGYRRVHIPERPFVFELILSSDVCLQFAASNADEASHWLHSFLVLFSLNGEFVDNEENLPTTCFVAICNNAVIVARHLSSPFMAKANLCNLTAVYSDSSVPNGVLLEFDSIEASAGCGEWIITFESSTETEKFLEILRNEWFKLFRTEMTLTSIKDLAIINKMRDMLDDVVMQKQVLQELCSEN